MASKTTLPQNAADPFANLGPADLKIVAAMAAATTKVEKASETLNRILAEAEKAGLHSKAGFSNFGRWAEAAMAAKGIRLSKSRAYNALKIATVRDSSPHSAALSDTVCLRIAEAGPAGDPERLAAFVAEVAKTGGTVEAVKAVKGGTGETLNAADALAAMIAERLWKVCKGDLREAEAILGTALDSYKAHCMEVAKGK